jgi:hypothetical protein
MYLLLRRIKHFRCTELREWTAPSARCVPSFRNGFPALLSPLVKAAFSVKILALQIQVISQTMSEALRTHGLSAGHGHIELFLGDERGRRRLKKDNWAGRLAAYD